MLFCATKQMFQHLFRGIEKVTDQIIMLNS